MENKTATDLVKEAKLKIEGLSPEQASKELLDENTILIDIRESEEIKQKEKREEQLVDTHKQQLKKLRKNLHKVKLENERAKDKAIKKQEAILN